MQIKNDIWEDIFISDGIDAQGHVLIEILEGAAYINKEQAEQIIKHLQEQFNL